jgi:hypothetical protein
MEFPRQFDALDIFQFHKIYAFGEDVKIAPLSVVEPLSSNLQNVRLLTELSFDIRMELARLTYC